MVPGLLRQSSETLAGRIEVVTLGGFSVAEVVSGVIDRHWLRGSFPRSQLQSLAAQCSHHSQGPCRIEAIFQSRCIV